jgi:hypothetical protein
VADIVWPIRGAAVGAKTSRIEIGAAVIDIRDENPFYMVEEAGAADLIDGRTGEKRSVGGSKRRSGGVPSPLSLPEREAAQASDESARAAGVRGSNPLRKSARAAAVSLAVKSCDVIKR